MFIWLVVSNSHLLKSLPVLGWWCQLNFERVGTLFAMDHTEWDKHVDVHDLFCPQWRQLERGTPVSVVVDGALFTTEMVIGVTLPDLQKVRIFGDVSSQVRGCRRLSVFSALVDFRPPFVDLLLTDASTVVAHGLGPMSDLFRLVELCAGVACSSVGFTAAGFKHVASVEWSQPLSRLHEACHPGVPVLNADVTDANCAQSILQLVDPPFSLMSGISCQPYSTGGSQGGSEDARASTLPATLKIGHLCQCPLIFIECVSPAQSNKFVQSHLRALENQLGYKVSDLTLRLEDNWAAKRMRWWVVAVHPCFGPVTVPAWPCHPHMSIRDIMPYVKQWPEDVMQELMLDEEEIRQFTLDGSHMRRYLVQMAGKLPTCLHSWGRQSKACPCLCRSSGFSDHLILQRGIFGQVLPVPVTQGSPRYRHFHPAELSLLNALPPLPGLLHAPGDLRLGLCAVGQLASPLQALWIGSNVACQLQHVMGMPTIDPTNAMQGFKGVLLNKAKELFLDVAPSVPVGSMVQVVFPDDTRFALHVPATATLRDLRSAELALNQHDCPVSWTDEASGRLLNDDDCIRGLSIRACFTRVASGLCPMSSRSDVPEPLPEPAVAGGPDCPASGSSVPDVEMVPWSAKPDPLVGLLHLQGPLLASLVPPLIPDCHQIQIMRKEHAGVDNRLMILSNQGSAMADDEILLHVGACIKLAGKADVCLLDPVLAVSWLRVGSPSQVRAWLDFSPDCLRVVSVVPLHDHWIPVVWTRGQRHVSVSIWEHDRTEIDGLNALHGLFCQAWQLEGVSVTCTRRTFAQSHCGAAAFAYLSHVLLGKPLPSDQAAVERLHKDLQESFAVAIMDLTVVPRPWCWGLGVPDVFGLVANLLQLHGVPLAQSNQRAKLIVQSLGKSEVTAAVTGGSPWKSLKSLANLHTPPVQLVLPDEQQERVNQKPPSKPRKKTGGERPAMPVRPRELDPSKIQLDHGAFCVGNDEPVDQLDFALLGPLSSGVALASYADAAPFLQADKLMTHRGLALLVLNPPKDFQCNLQWASVRFAARCALNQEPMLLLGALVQLGNTVVYQYKAQNTPAIMSVDVACARVTVFADQWEGSWEEFAAKPIKHILAAIPQLQTCRAESCTCVSWHATAEGPHEALLDVFRRQFLNEAGRPVKWEHAASFAVMIRYVKALEPAVIAVSGKSGLFVEPKTEDASQPHGDYQVIWLPQLDYAAIAHKAKCEAHCVGIARSGRRFGLRVHVSHFQQVFASVKPDGVFLAPGSRSTFHCGPWPYGSDRKGLAKILKASGWECRPLQPLHNVPGGLMWSVQAVMEPPANVLSMQHGQVVITRHDAKAAQQGPDMPVIGQAKTVQLCSIADAAGQDPWLTNDPWKQAANMMPQPPSGNASAACALHELEQRIENKVLAKLPAQTDRMEVDNQDQRLSLLEQQVQHLTSRQTSLESTVTDHHAQNTAQVQGLQQQMMMQLDMQSKQMQSMLTDQMTRLETILAKKPRTE